MSRTDFRGGRRIYLRKNKNLDSSWRLSCTWAVHGHHRRSYRPCKTGGGGRSYIIARNDLSSTTRTHIMSYNMTSIRRRRNGPRRFWRGEGREAKHACTKRLNFSDKKKKKNVGHMRYIFFPLTGFIPNVFINIIYTHTHTHYVRILYGL